MSAAERSRVGRWARRSRGGAIGFFALLAALEPASCQKRDSAPTGPAPIPTPVAAPRGAVEVDGGSPGCGQAAESPRGASYATANARTFHVWGPDSYDPARAYPVVLAFHGWYSNGRDFQKWFKMEDHVGGAAFTVYPDAKGPTWDIGGASDLDFTAAVIDGLAKQYCIDRARVYALGFSYGGKLVHHLGCKRPSLVRAISVGDGSWAGERECVAPLPVLVTHRTRDDDERIAWGKDAAARWAVLDGCSGAEVPTDVAHGCTAFPACKPGASVTFCEDTHFDPTWPHDWNHTIREEYRSLTWKWFDSLR